MRDKILFALFYFGLLCLFFYSYTQVDLNLTLSQNPYILSFQRFFQQIGFFQRPLSTALYLSILTLLSVLYFIFLRAGELGHITKRQIWILILATVVILNFSYNAFSYDLFNYIFDAKIITHYHQNPYLHRALDFPGDPMLLFMHWTHRLYPYGPTWLLETVPLSFLGMGFFLPTLFLLKTLITASFLGTVYFIGKILKVISPSNEKLGILFFALNPLIIAESLVSSHNDIAMMLFAVWAFYLLVSRKYPFAILALLLSVGVKFATILLLPIFLFVILKKGKVNWDKMILFSILLMLVGVVLASFRTEFQPWYLIYFLPFAALLIKKDYVLFPSIIISLVGILFYIPFLYLGNWDKPVPTILFWLTAIGSAVSIFIIALKYRRI